MISLAMQMFRRVPRNAYTALQATSTIFQELLRPEVAELPTLTIHELLLLPLQNLGFSKGVLKH